MHFNKLLFFVITLAACLTQFASDIYAPSVPAIATALHTPIHWVQWSMAIYMFGVAFSELVYGPISEGVGRKKPLVLGLCIMLAGSFICLFSTNIQLLIVGRLIQGCGAGACAALWRSVFRDVFTGEQLAKYGSYLVILIMFIVPAAPALGGYLQHYFSWRAVFMFVSFYGLIALLLMLYGFKETNRYHHSERLQWVYIVETYKKLLTSRIFMGITLCTFLSYGAFFSWFVTSPVLLIHVVGISPVAFGWFTFLGGGSAYALAGWLNGKLVSKAGMPTMMRFGFSVMLLSGLVLLIFKLIVGINIAAIVVPLILFYFGSTFIWPNAFATAFTPFGDIAGYAGALYGCMQIGGAAVIGTLASYLPTFSQTPLIFIVLAATLIAWLVYEKTLVQK